ncbi:MAG: TlpA family protein disulfide reductase [Bradymonadales bacterium]|nr:TlpA family protein disulfide reductase [Bradymonadales bacterium]
MKRKTTIARLLQAALILLVSTGLTACGDESDNQPVDTGPREGYPTGPYGVTEGSILADLEFTSVDDTPFSLQDIYADGHNQVLLINTAAGWCTACIEEMPALQELYDTYGGKGLFVLVTVFENLNYQAATAADAATWKQRYDLTTEVVADPAFLLQDYYDSTFTPMNMIVEVPTMKIVRITTGFDRSAIESLIRRYTL